MDSELLGGEGLLVHLSNQGQDDSFSQSMAFLGPLATFCFGHIPDIEVQRMQI